jgi:hypothetical protein
MHIRCLPNRLEIFFECFMPPTSRCKVPGLYLGVRSLSLLTSTGKIKGSFPGDFQGNKRVLQRHRGSFSRLSNSWPAM